MIFILPTHLQRVRGKPIPININWYRNAHYRSLNNAKKAYSEYVRAALEPLSTPIIINYTLWVGTARKCDVDNVMGVTKKFFQDALVDKGWLPGDDYRYIVGSTERFGGIDRCNPRVEAVIERDIQS